MEPIMILLSLRAAVAHAFGWLDRRLTDGAYQHGRYCVSDQKIRRRTAY
jgi:hypothetical protein